MHPSAVIENSWFTGPSVHWISSALPCLLYLVTALSDILLMQLFHSRRASRKENWSMTLDVNLSTACDTVLILQNDLWPDGFLAWGYFCKGPTSASRRLQNCLENFWQWVLEIPLGWVPLLLTSTFWFQLPIQAYCPNSKFSSDSLSVLLRCSISPFKKGIRKTGILFGKYRLWTLPNPWANGRTMRQRGKNRVGIFQTGVS